MGSRANSGAPSHVTLRWTRSGSAFLRAAGSPRWILGMSAMRRKRALGSMSAEGGKRTLRARQTPLWSSRGNRRTPDVAAPYRLADDMVATCRNAREAEHEYRKAQ